MWFSAYDNVLLVLSIPDVPPPVLNPGITLSSRDSPVLPAVPLGDKHADTYHITTGDNNSTPSSFAIRLLVRYEDRANQCGKEETQLAQVVSTARLVRSRGTTVVTHDFRSSNTG